MCAEVRRQPGRELGLAGATNSNSLIRNTWHVNTAVSLLLIVVDVSRTR